jgi:hypothetical protein
VFFIDLAPLALASLCYDTTGQTDEPPAYFNSEPTLSHMTLLATVTHRQAADIVRAAFVREMGRQPTEAERALLQAVAWGESHYGRAPGQHAAWVSEGKVTWGNIEVQRRADGTCPAGTLPGKDAGNDRCFVVDDSDVDAARRMIHTMLLMGLANGTQRERDFHARSGGIAAALATGDPRQLARAMKHPASVAYYEAPEETYAKLLGDTLALVDREVPRSAAPPPDSRVSGLGVFRWGLIVAAGYGAWRWWRSR